MTPPRRSLPGLFTDPPRPWHLLLTPAIPLLGMLKDVLGFVPATVIVLPLAVAITLSLVLAAVLLPLGADRHRSALAVSLLTLTGISYMTITLPVSAVAPPAAVALVYAVVVLGAIKLLRTAGSAAVLTVTANRAVAIAVVLLTLPILWSEWRRPTTTVAPLEIPSARSARPDVYVIVLDGYGRADVLRELFGFENDLVPVLRANGFFVGDRAAANYSQTALSLASALNVEYLAALGPVVRNRTDRRGLGDLINDSRFFRAFADAGYSIRSYSSEYSLVRPRTADDRPSPLGHLNDFSFTVYETTIVPTLLDAVGLERGAVPMRLHRRHITWTLDHLTNSASFGPMPALVFAHVLAPHPPFVFDANGGPRRSRMPALLGDGDLWRRMALSTGEDYKSGYVDAVRALNARLIAMLKAIDARDRKSIVLIHGDHGPGAGLDWEHPDRSDMRERMAILAAVRFPDGELPPLDQGSSPVNLYRAVINRALGARLPTIENKSFHSTWERPFDLIDVTGRLN